MKCICTLSNNPSGTDCFFCGGTLELNIIKRNYGATHHKESKTEKTPEEKRLELALSINSQIEFCYRKLEEKLENKELKLTKKKIKELRNQIDIFSEFVNKCFDKKESVIVDKLNIKLFKKSTLLINEFKEKTKKKKKKKPLIIAELPERFTKSGKRKIIAKN